MALDPDAFRKGMRGLAASVCIVTTVDPAGERAGLTATAVCSVSADPPTLLCCVNRRGATHAALRANGVFAVNVLSLEDRNLAARFAGGGVGDRFAEGLWASLVTGSPILESAVASFDCRLAHAVEVGTHGILFGEIQSIRMREAEPAPLLYARGSYGGFAAVDAVRRPELLWMPSWVADDS